MTKPKVVKQVNEQVVLHQYTEDAYLKYAIASVRDRALAQVQDGQKPVQKRILYSMKDLGLSSDSKPVKSARVVGDVIGRLHPHGDGAVYDALVRMAQDFSLRYPIITGQGNFGSRDGDSAAAYRYTECRLSMMSDLLLSETNRGTVDFQPNFDNTAQEPRVLPARLPVLLLNGSMGIAVGMASDIPPHNLKEVADAAVALVEKPKLSESEILDFIKGPDFPDGGQIISSRDEMLAAYSSGRGILRMRARWLKEDLARGQWQIVINEMPYQVSSRKVLEQIEAICNPQPPKGKSITQQQAYLKQAALGLLEKATDESGKDAKIRLVISPRTSKVDPDDLMKFLFANTDLESSVSVNMTFIGIDGRPQTRGLPEILRQWCEFRVGTVRRRVEFDLEKLRRRIHLLEGRMIVFLNIDKVIKVIRDAENPKEDLMAKFKLSEAQADDILEIRLRQLARLEGIKIEKELKEARKEAETLEGHLATDKALRKLVASEIKIDAEKYGDARRTLIKEERRAETQAAATRSVLDEPLTVILSKNLWIRARAGHDVDLATLTYKSGDQGLAIIKTRTTLPVVFVDSRGRAYSVDASLIPTGRGDGVPLSTLIEIQEGARIMHVLSAEPATSYVFAGTRGYGFRAPLQALLARPRAGKAFLTLQEDETPLAPLEVPSDGKGFLACGSSDGRLLVFPLEEVKELDKGKGVVLMDLADDASLAGIVYGANEPFEVPVTGKPAVFALKGDDWRKFVMHRARRGCQLPKKAVISVG
jgi:topoisomerase IV subunit A